MKKLCRTIVLLALVCITMAGCTTKESVIEEGGTSTSSISTTEEIQETSSSIEQTASSSETKTTSTSSIEAMQWSAEQSAALADAMVLFGDEMGQNSYAKVETPETLTFQSGESFEGYRVLESYQYQNGETVHRYFFVLNPDGGPLVLYSTGGTDVKPTMNELLPKMFAEIVDGIDVTSLAESPAMIRYETEYFIIEIPEAWEGQWTVTETVDGYVRNYTFYYDGGSAIVSVIPNRNSYMVGISSEAAAGFFNRPGGAKIVWSLNGGLD
ncbi:hypothetical protein [Streptococcus suis]|uniref:hypothetical protein n=1 Tax=Streptococcus suis TaxID=1307 RepID=UPI001ABE62D1|nr:hypothetical protein [Streptococcus suis]